MNTAKPIKQSSQPGFNSLIPLLETKRDNLAHRQQLLLKAIKETTCDFYQACLKTNVPYKTFKRWQSENEDFRTAIDEIEAEILDKCESNVYHASNQPNAPYLSLQVLEMRRKEKWSRQNAVNLNLANITIVSSISDREDEKIDSGASVEEISTSNDLSKE